MFHIDSRAYLDLGGGGGGCNPLYDLYGMCRWSG